MATIRLTWSISDGAVAYNIYHATRPGLSIAFTPLLATTPNLTYDHIGLQLLSKHYYIVAAVGPNNEISAPTDEIYVIAGTIVSINITPANLHIIRGNTQQYTAIATFNDNSTADITNLATWASSNPSFATINSTGFLQTISNGTTTISAELNSVTGTTSAVVISLSSIAITPIAPTINVGSTQQFTATGTYTDSSTIDLTTSVSWLSSITNNATITSGGLLSGIHSGSTNVSATYNTFSDSTLVTINPILTSIVVTPTNITIAYPNTQQYTAIGHYNDSTTQNITSSVTWASTDTNAATIASGGLLTVHHAGTPTISATLGLVSGSTGLTVTVSLLSIAVTPSSPTISINSTQQMTATGTYSDSSTVDITNSVTWLSGTPANAIINSTGLVTGILAGSSIITATLSAISGNTTATIVAGGPTITNVNPTAGNNITYIQGIGRLTSGAHSGTMAFVNNGYYYSTNDGNTQHAVYYSTDGGATLNNASSIDPYFLTNGGDVGYIFSMWTNGTKFFVVGDAASEGSNGTGNIYTSTDGINWLAGTIGQIQTLPGNIVGAPMETLSGIHGLGNEVYVVSNSNTFFNSFSGQYATSSSVYYSADGGFSFSHPFTITGADTSHRSVYANTVFMAASNAVWVGGNHMLWFYNGLTWTDMYSTLLAATGNLTADINSIWASGANDVWFVDTSHKFAGANNVIRWNGSSFTAFDFSTRSGNKTMWQVSGQSANLIMVVGDPGGGHANWWQTTDHGTTWTQVDPSLSSSTFLTCLYSQDGNNIWAAGDPLIHYQD